MNNNNLKIISFDIGGVIRDLQSGEPLPGAIESINEIINAGHKVYFISKCKPQMEINITEWLKTMSLDHIPVFFCREYIDKVTIGTKLKINMMVDDKMQVLTLFPETVKKVWFCDDKQKIEGTKKHQPEFLSSCTLVKNWTEILYIC